MPTLLYIHGFLSSPQSHKAQQTQKWLSYHRPDWLFSCPFLSSNPAEAKEELDGLMATLGSEVYLMGSSLGGFWATYLAEKYGLRAVLINPAVRAHRHFADLVGKPLKHYHTGQSVTLSDRDLAVLEAVDPPIADADRYWLLVQTGDETLDYRHAVAKYLGCRQTVEAGGDHSFAGFEGWLPELIQFFEEV